MVGHIHSRSIWRWKILQALKLDVIKWSNGQGCPCPGNKMVSISTASIKQEYKRMLHKHDHEQKDGRESSDRVKANRSHFRPQLQSCKREDVSW